MFLLGLLSVACAAKPAAPRDDVGDISIALALPGGAIVNSVSYTVSGNGIVPIMGTIDVSAPGTTQATVFVSGLVEGSYTVTMTTMTSDGQSCSGMAPFTIVRGQTAAATVIVQCNRTPTSGSVVVTGGIDQCPFITGISASSLQVPVGGNINVAVAANDLDGDNIGYTWANSTPATGSLAPLNAPMAVFHCTAPGTTQLSIAVTDGVCGDSLTNAIPITCTPGLTGAAGAGGGAGGAGGSSAGGGAGGGGGAAGTGGSAAGAGGAAAGTGGAAAGTGGSAAGTGGGAAGAGGGAAGMGGSAAGTGGGAAGTGGGAAGTGGAAGAAPVTVSGLTGPDFAAVGSDGFLYVTEYDAGFVTRVMFDGSAPVRISGPGVQYAGIDVDTAGTIYYATHSNGRVFRVPLAGGTGVAASPTLDQLLGVAVDTANQYMAMATGAIRRSSKASSGVTISTVLATETGPIDIAVDDTNLYWTLYNPGTIRTMPKAGGTITSLYVETGSGNSANAYGLDVDGTYVYWVRPNDGAVLRIPKAGGTAQVIGFPLGTTPAVNKLTDVTSDAQYLYVVGYASGQVIRIAKP